MFVFFVWAYDLVEKPHVHIRKGKSKSGVAKIWIEDQKIADTGGFTEKELSVCQKFIQENQTYFLDQLDAFKNGNKVKFKTFR